MPFTTSKFSAQFMGRILDNIQTALERDTETALRAIDENLPVFADFRTKIEDALNFPCLYLEPDKTDIDQSDDDESLNQIHSLVVTLSLVEASDYALIRNMLKYIKAVDQVLRTMTGSEIVGGISPEASGVRWEVTDHLYGVAQPKEGTIYRRNAQLIFRVKTLEL